MLSKLCKLLVFAVSVAVAQDGNDTSALAAFQQNICQTCTTDGDCANGYTCDTTSGLCYFDECDMNDDCAGDEICWIEACCDTTFSDYVLLSSICVTDMCNQGSGLSQSNIPSNHTMAAYTCATDGLFYLLDSDIECNGVCPANDDSVCLVDETTDSPILIESTDMSSTTKPNKKDEDDGFIEDIQDALSIGTGDWIFGAIIAGGAGVIILILLIVCCCICCKKKKKKLPQRPERGLSSEVIAEMERVHSNSKQKKQSTVAYVRESVGNQQTAGQAYHNRDQRYLL